MSAKYSFSHPSQGANRSLLGRSPHLQALPPKEHSPAAPWPGQPGVSQLLSHVLPRPDRNQKAQRQGAQKAGGAQSRGECRGGEGQVQDSSQSKDPQLGLHSACSCWLLGCGPDMGEAAPGWQQPSRGDRHFYSVQAQVRPLWAHATAVLSMWPATVLSQPGPRYGRQERTCNLGAWLLSYSWLTVATGHKRPPDWKCHLREVGRAGASTWHTATAS